MVSLCTALYICATFFSIVTSPTAIIIAPNFLSRNCFMRWRSVPLILPFPLSSPSLFLPLPQTSTLFPFVIMLWLETVIISDAWLKCYLLSLTLHQTWRKEVRLVVSFLILIWDPSPNGFDFISTFSSPGLTLWDKHTNAYRSPPFKFGKEKKNVYKKQMQTAGLKPDSINPLFPLPPTQWCSLSCTLSASLTCSFYSATPIFSG